MQDGKRIIMGLLFLAGTMVSCVKDPKDIPPGFTDAADFGMSAGFGNETVVLAAGTNQWTMLPVVGYQDSLDVYTAIFSLNGCVEQCTPSWTFHFYQAIPGSLDPSADFNATIHPGEKQLVLSDQELDSFDIELSTHPGLFMSGYSYWDDLNGPTTFFHEYGTVLGYQDQLNVCFQSLAYTGCHYTQCIYFDPSTAVPCIASIEARLQNSSYVSLNVRPEGTPPFQYQWSNESTAPSIVIPIQNDSTEIYAGVTVIDALGNRAELIQSIRVRVQDSIVDACYFPIQLSSSQVENHSASVYANRMDISYTDEQGVVWRSTSGVQPSDANVIIESVSDYGISPFNQASSLVELTAKVMLFNEDTGEGKLFETTQLTIALSHR
jgi:hypothetical protein